MGKALKWVAIGFIALIVLGAIFGNNEDPPKDKAANARTAPVAETPSEDAPEPSPVPTPEPLNVNFTGPTQTTSDQVRLKGRVAVKGVKVKVDGKPATVRGRRWSYVASIARKGDNPYKVIATKAGHKSDRTTAVVTRNLSAAEKAAQREAERQAFINAATTIPYNQLAKNPKRYKGTKVSYRGQIFQIQEDGGETWMLLSVTDEGYGFWDDNVWVEYDGTINGAEEDVITVYGTIAGEQSYETQIGGETYVPKMRARYIVE
jgi:hypothetical protein